MLGPNCSAAFASVASFASDHKIPASTAKHLPCLLLPVHADKHRLDFPCVQPSFVARVGPVEPEPEPSSAFLTSLLESQVFRAAVLSGIGLLRRSCAPGSSVSLRRSFV